MKLILITLVAVVVGMMVGCGGGNDYETASQGKSRLFQVPPTSTPGKSAFRKALEGIPTETAINVPSPAFTDDEVFGAVKGHLRSAGMADFCKSILIYIDPELWRVRQDKSNPDKYLVTISGEPDFSWTFIGSLGKVFSTSKELPGAYGC